MNKAQLQAAVNARINQISAALSTVSDEAAVDLTTLFPLWEPSIAYTVGTRIQYNEKLYKVIQSHTSQVDWTPDLTPALYTEVAKPGEIPEWKQPIGASDAYMIGDKVQHNDLIWESNIDNNVWEPGIYGWTSIG